MTLAEFQSKWEARRIEAKRLHTTVSLEAIADEVLEDLEQVELTGGAESLTLDEAARESGYSADHLRHLIADGTLANAGRKHAPRLRRAELPRKPAAVRRQQAVSAYDADHDALTLVRGMQHARNAAGENLR